MGAGIPGLLPPRFALQEQVARRSGDWTGKVVIVGVYRAARYGFHKTVNQQSWGLRTEVHHRPGDDVTKEFFRSTLEPLGFDVGVYPHNHQIGAEALSGVVGAANGNTGSAICCRDAGHRRPPARCR